MLILQLTATVLIGLLGLALGASGVYLVMRMRGLSARIRALEAALFGPLGPVPGDGTVQPQRLGRLTLYEAAEQAIDAVAALTALREKRMLEVEHYDNVRSHLAKALETGTKRATVPVRDEKEL
jgi:hypothetical protein